MKNRKPFVGEQRKAFAPFYREVVIREVLKNSVVCSLGFDSKGNDITTLVDINDILPRQ